MPSPRCWRSAGLSLASPPSRSTPRAAWRWSRPTRASQRWTCACERSRVRIRATSAGQASSSQPSLPDVSGSWPPWRIAGTSRRSTARRPARSASRHNRSTPHSDQRMRPSERVSSMTCVIRLIGFRGGLDLGRLIPAFGGLVPLRGRGGRALAPGNYGRGVQEDQRVSPTLEGGVAMPGSVGLGTLVNLPACPFVPVAAGLARPHHPPGPVRRPILGAAVAGVLGAGCSSAWWMPASNSSNLAGVKRSTSRRQRVTSCTTMISAFRRAGALPVAIACAWAETNVYHPAWAASLSSFFVRSRSRLSCPGSNRSSSSWPVRA